MSVRSPRLCASSSLSTLRFATTDFSRRLSSSSTSTSRLLMPASPPARNRSRHCVRVAMVTRCLREVASRSAPRNNSRTTEVLRFADHRPSTCTANLQNRRAPRRFLAERLSQRPLLAPRLARANPAGRNRSASAVQLVVHASLMFAFLRVSASLR
jgi:hypothetical protein